MRPSKRISQRIALQRIHNLFQLADTVVKQDQDQARRYLQLAKRISEKSNVSIPSDLKRQYCRSCYSLLKPGTTAKITLNSEKQTKNITCCHCGRTYRFPYSSTALNERQQEPNNESQQSS